MTAVADIAAERRRQIEAEGWTAEHDDEHDDGEMLAAARCYLTGSLAGWPWDMKWWKPTTPRRDAVKAGALALAEKSRLERDGAADGEIREAERTYDLALASIERIDRLSAKPEDIFADLGTQAGVGI